MKLLHICQDFVFTKLYQQLIDGIAQVSNIDQVMYVPLQATAQYNESDFVTNREYELIISRDFRLMERFFYHWKLDKVYYSIARQLKFADIDVIHAHSLFSNGGLAYRIKKKVGIPYIVAVRNTDVNIHFKYRPNLKQYGLKILSEAAQIVFISPAYKKYVISNLIPMELRSQIESKSLVIPNGIHNYWHENQATRKLYTGSEIKLLYIGGITKNKNIDTTIRAAELLHGQGYNVSLKIVGGGVFEKKIRQLAAKCSFPIELTGKLESKELIRNAYAGSDILVMPSRCETFGLVYIEAMSQGTPVIYSKGQGIDGYFRNGEIGYSVDPDDIGQIASNILKIIENYNEMSDACVNSINTFDWKGIASKYVEIYRSIQHEKSIDLACCKTI